MHNPHLLREAAYFGDGTRSLFGWYHSAGSRTGRDCVAVICGPIGYEYTHSHRTVRHLADRLALRGIPALRFDYDGTGDSPGTDFDPDRLSRWQSDILAAVARAKASSGCSSVCLIGIRLGATLAAFAASECDIDLLVMWNPCVKGSTYLRELQAIAMTAERSSSGADGTLESAGFILSAETVAALRKVDLTKSPLRVRRRALLLSRDDQASDTALEQHLAATGITCDHSRAPGWTGMMAEEQFTVVPDAALDVLVDWTVDNSAPAMDHPDGLSPPGLKETRTTLTIAFNDGNGTCDSIEEQLCCFGSDSHLFGILSRASADQDRPAILMFNSGSVHHVGPHRVYVALARSLSAMGFACFRFDLEGIGDSVRRDDGRENHPYPDWAIADARSALDFLAQRFGYKRFIVMGLCSGAHSAFHAGLSIHDYGIGELIAINPLTFYWKEGTSLSTARQFADLNWYKGTMRDPRHWLKLLSGEVNVRRPIAVVWGHLVNTVRSHLGALREALFPGKSPQLSQDLRKLFAMNRKVTFIIAEGDPGIEILKAGARYTAMKGLRSGQICLEMIPDADHTFSQLRARTVLIEWLCAHLEPMLAVDAAREMRNNAPATPLGTA